jgi:hypothetical protein
MSPADLDRLTDDEWAMLWHDLVWVRKQEKNEGGTLRKLGLIK